MYIIQAKNIPAELIERRQWLIWRFIQKPGEPKPAKVPHTCQGYAASHSNPDHWSTFEFGLKAFARPGFCDGIGYVFSPDDPYTGIDLDNIYPSDAAECAPWAEGILEHFRDTYLEASPSDCGIKIWSRGRTPRSGKWPVEYGAIEIYSEKRFFTLTGRSNRVLTIADHQADIERLVGNLDSDRATTLSRPTITGGTIPKGQRHPALISLAGTMHRRGMDLEAIEAALLVVNTKQCDPPYPAEHIHNKIVASMANWRR